MVLYKKFDEIPSDKPTVVTIGTFDGLHRGHKALLHRLREKAKELSARSLLITFEPHPQTILEKSGKGAIRLLTSQKERLSLFHSLDADGVLLIPFTREFSQIPAEEFVRDYLVGKVNMKHIVVGYDHLFGKDRQGNEELLKTLGQELDFTVEKVEALEMGEQPVSSTLIRKALLSNDIKQANSMLGYPYIVSGIVVQGDGRGRKLGIPTANVAVQDPYKLLPANGVYLISCLIDGHNVFGMANIGTRPTFTNDTEPTLEVHFFDWNKMLYGRELSIAFLDFIRKEQKFISIDMFFAQMSDDMMTCRELIERIENGTF